MQEEHFFLGEKSNRMVTVTPFLGKLKVHIRQFYVNEKGESKPGKNGIVLDLEEFEALAKLVPKVQNSIAKYETGDTGIPSSPFQLDLPVLDLDTDLLPSPPSQEPIPFIINEELFDSQPKFPASPPPPLSIEPSLENILSDIRVGEQSNPTEIDFENDGKRKMINDCDHKCSKAVGFSYPGIVLHCSECESEKKKENTLESIDENSPNRLKGKRKRSSEVTRNVNKKSKVENSKTSGIFVGYAKLPPDMKEEQKKERKIFTKKKCIDEVASVESMKEVERKLWLTHYDILCKKLNEVVTEKCTGCQMNEPNQLGHEFCLLASVEEQVNTCFGEVYKLVIWDEVLDNWYKKVLEMPVALNPETLIIFKESVNLKDFTYKNRLKKWMIESPTVGL